jgi:PAS domain S-box-containing protein
LTMRESPNPSDSPCSGRSTYMAGEFAALCQSSSVLEAVIRHTDHAVMAVDLDGTVLMWNPASEELSGWSAHDVIGRPFDELITGSREGLLSELRALAASDAPMERVVRVRRKDGSITRVSVTLVPLRDAQGFTCCVLVVANFLAEDERFDSLRGRFADLVATELRGPLTSILGYAQLLTASDVLEDPEERRRIGGLLDQRCTELSALLDDLMALGGLADGEGSGARERVDMCDMAEAVADRITAYRPDCALTVDAASTSAPVMVDRVRFEHALEGLMSAALDDAPSCRVDVHVDCHGADAVVAIRESRAPSGRAKQPRSSDRRRSPVGGARNVPGLRTSVRLRYAERFADDHEGDVSGSHDAAHGSSFVMRLPLAATVGA